MLWETPLMISIEDFQNQEVPFFFVLMFSFLSCNIGGMWTLFSLWFFLLSKRFLLLSDFKPLLFIESFFESSYITKTSLLIRANACYTFHTPQTQKNYRLPKAKRTVCNHGGIAITKIVSGCEDEEKHTSKKQRVEYPNSYLGPPDNTCANLKPPLTGFLRWTISQCFHLS